MTKRTFSKLTLASLALTLALAPSGCFAQAMAASSPNAPSKPVVALDCFHNNSHYTWGQPGHGVYSQFANLISSLGADTVSVRGAVDSTVLSQCSIFILVDPLSRCPHISAEEIEALDKWVRGGGRLMLLANNAGNCEFTHLNELGAKFGIHFNEDTYHGAPDLTPLPSHAFFEHCHALHIVGQCTLALSAPAKPVLTLNGETLMATSVAGKGVVFAIGDPWLYDEYINTKDNRASGTNVMKWLLDGARIPAAVVPGASRPPLSADASPAPTPSRDPSRPAPRLTDNNGKPTWLGVLHQSNLKRGKDGPIGVLFFGDSIPNGWNIRKELKEIWNRHYGACQPANFAQGDASPKGLFWHLDSGEFDGIAPKVVVLSCGGNGIGATAPEVILGDDGKLVSEIHAKLPHTKILLLGIVPRGADPKVPADAKLRERIATVNQGLAKLDDGKQIRYLDLGPNFLDSHGAQIKDAFLPDGFHLSVKGYQIWAEAMQPLLDEMMK